MRCVGAAQMNDHESPIFLDIMEFDRGKPATVADEEHGPAFGNARGNRREME